MKINSDGWAEQEHAGESVPAAMHNALKAARDRESSQIIPTDEWAKAIEEREEKDR